MGIGVLLRQGSALDAMPPFLRGGDMIEYVSEQETTFAELPQKSSRGGHAERRRRGRPAPPSSTFEKTGFGPCAASSRSS